MIMRKFFLVLIGFYRLVISPMLGNHCRYYPTCSEYAQQAIQIHGAGKGLWLAIKRISRCHPWHEGGVDPVPEKSTTQTHKCKCK